MRHVAAKLVIGSHGQACVTRGYTEVGGVRIFDDQLVIGKYGQAELSPGWTEVVAPAPQSLGRLRGLKL